MKPVARRSDVIVQQIGTDLVVYDELNDRAHSLNPVAAYVYEHADGTRDVGALAAELTTALGIPNDPAIVEDALAGLERVELLTGHRGKGRRGVIARREALRRIGLSAAALPIITSLVAPPPLLARSGPGANGGNAYGQSQGNGPGANNGNHNGPGTNNGNHTGQTQGQRNGHP